jgi:type I site-specific restriction endonuclease
MRSSSCLPTGRNKTGKPLAVIEAKRTAIDPEKGREQARLYADALEREHGQRPVIFYTNVPERTQPYRPAAKRESTFSPLPGI